MASLHGIAMTMVVPGRSVAQAIADTATRAGPRAQHRAPLAAHCPGHTRMRPAQRQDAAAETCGNPASFHGFFRIPIEFGPSHALYKPLLVVLE